MSVKYNRVPTNDPDFSETVVDFSSIFSYDYPKYFSHSSKPQKYKSMFTYSGKTPDSSYDNIIDRDKPSVLITCCGALVTVLCYILVALTLPISAWFTFRNIQQNERLVVFRLGRLLSTKGPGLVVLLPCIDKAYSVDLKTKAFSVPPMNLLTADGATVEMGADIYYHIYDPVMSVAYVRDLNHATRVISQTLFQRHMGKYNVKDLETSKAMIAETLQNDINGMTKTWGVKLERIDMSQVRVIAEADPLVSQASNPLSVLGPMLFPPGTSQAPLQQLQEQFVSLFSQGPRLVPPGTVELSPEAASVQGGGGGRMALEAVPEQLEVQTPTDLMLMVRPHLSATLVAEFGCVYKFRVQSQDGVEVFYLDLKNGEGTVGSGEPPEGTIPDATLTLSQEDFLCLIRGQLNTFSAYMTGRLSVDGDLAAAKRLAELVDHIRQSTA